MPTLKIEDVEYGTFEDVLAIEDQGLKADAVKQWSILEHEEKKNPPKEDEKKAEENEEESEDVKDKEVEEKDDNEEKTSDAAPEKETSDDDKGTPEKDTADTEEKTDEEDAPEKETDESEVNQEERIKMYAEKHDLKIEDASKAVEKIDIIKSKFGDDPDEIAYAAYSAQRSHSLLQEQNRRAQLASQSPFEWREDSVIYHGKREDGTHFDEKYSKEKVIENFRVKHPDDTEKLEDDAVFALAKLDNKQWFENQISSQESAVVSHSEKKANEFFKNLKEKDKRFEKETRDASARLSPYDIVDNEHALVAMLNMVKGTKLDDVEEKHKKELKDAEKRGFERGQKNAVILGKEEKKADSGGNDTKIKGKQYSEEYKIKALNKFSTYRLPDEEKFKLYEDIDALEQKRRNR